MIKFFISIVCFVIALSTCNGCSFIKDRFTNIQQTSREQDNEQQSEQQEERKPEPIPVSPPHS